MSALSAIIFATLTVGTIAGPIWPITVQSEVVAVATPVSAANMTIVSLPSNLAMPRPLITTVTQYETVVTETIVPAPTSTTVEYVVIVTATPGLAPDTAPVSVSAANATPLASTLSPVYINATATAASASAPPSTAAVANVFSGALVQSSHTCNYNVSREGGFCQCGPQIKEFDSVTLNRTVNACPEAVDVIHWDGVPKVVFAPGDIWHYHHTDLKGSPMTFGPFITCPQVQSCEPIFRPDPPPKPFVKPWSICRWHYNWWQNRYQICGGGDWPEGSLGLDGELAQKFNGCGIAPKDMQWFTRGLPKPEYEWCYHVAHLMGAKNCMGNVLEWQFHTGRDTCWGVG